MDFRFVYMTTGDADEAERIGSALVRERLAACVNIIDGMRSIYWWEGEVQKATEAVLVAKTRERLLDALTKRVRELHSYDCPCIVALPIVGGDADYIEWLGAEMAGDLPE